MIGEKVFKNCTSLKDVYILSPTVSIARRAMFSGCYGYTIHAPAGSVVEKDLKGKNCVPLTEEDAKRLVKYYFAEPIKRKVYFNRSNAGTRNSIEAGEPIEVAKNGDLLAIRRENGKLYDLDIPPLFGDLITGKIISKTYTASNGDTCDANHFYVELYMKDGIA